MNAGSHTVLSLLDHGCKVTIIDNLDNAFQIAYTRMQKLAGDNSKNMTFVKVKLESVLHCPSPGTVQALRLCTVATSEVGFAALQGDLRNFTELDKLFAAEK